ncbi:MAG: hypothetical protein ACR2O3_17665 [Rhizobiaceae bacterium]
MDQTTINQSFKFVENSAGRQTGAAFDRRMPGHLDRIAREHANEDEKPGLSPKIAKTILVVAAVLLLLSLILYYAALLFGDDISRSGHSASTERLEIVTGNSALRIPANSIRFGNQRKAGSHQRIEMYLHWPTLSGYSDALDGAFSRTGDQSELIFMSLEPRSMSLEMSGRIEPIYSRFFKGKAKSGPAGLVMQPLSADGGFIDEDLFYEAGSPYPYAVRCVRPKSALSTPFCIRDIHIGKDLMLSYRFHVRHLPEWLKIDQSIRKKVSGFIISR